MAAVSAEGPRIWKTISCPIKELNLRNTLTCGQSFRWKEINSEEWIGVIGKNVWILKQNEKEISYTTVQKESKSNPEENSKRQMSKKEDKKNRDEDMLRDYFQLHIPLVKLYDTWSKKDGIFKKTVSSNFGGIRILRQDPVENLFSFICTSNNNIPRIASLVGKLCSNYGEEIAEVDDQKYFTFPTVQVLAQTGVEEKLRSLGFGYRAKYISKSAKYIIKNNDEEWLYSLRKVTYRIARAQLQELTGVGTKIADCVCLMSLDKAGAVPVDTHVWQIAARDYLPRLKQARSLTDKLYNEIGDYFRELWGEYAGWAHSVLFAADLRKFKGEPVKQNPDVSEGQFTDDSKFIFTAKRKRETRTEAKTRKLD